MLLFLVQGSGSNIHRPYREATINSLKHRFLVFLYRRAKRISQESHSPYELRKFYQYFDQVSVGILQFVTS